MDLIIKINASSRKVEQWGMCKLHQISLHPRVSAHFALVQWDLLTRGKGWGSWLLPLGSSGPLTSVRYRSIEAAYWGCCRQFAVFPGWTLRNALFLLQHNPTSPWTAWSLPAAQSDLACPAGIGREGGKRDCCDCFDPNQRNSPFALSILRYTRIRDLGNVCNATAQPSQTLWHRTRVAHPPQACQNWALDSLLLVCYWDTMQPHTYEAKITLAWIYFGFMEKEWGEGGKPQRKRGKGKKRRFWGREKGTWSKERKAENEVIQILMLVWN